MDSDRAVGKIGSDIFRRIIAPRLGAVRSDVLVGPRHGVDCGVIDISGGRVMVLTTDPLFVMPELGWERAGWLAVHIIASDAATSGLYPSYLTVDLNLPHSITTDHLGALWESVSAACADIDVAIVSGHTGRYDRCAFPIIGAATAVCIGGRDCYVSPDMVQPGDAVIVTKGAAIETTAMFGALLADRITTALGPATARAAAALFQQVSVVRDAAVAVTVGVRDAGISSMHDAAERGVWGGLVELAQAAGAGLIVDRDAIIIRPEVAAICDYFRVDPYSSSSEGTLLITCRVQRAPAAIARLADAGIGATIVGEILPTDAGIHVVRNGREEPLQSPVSDPFWPALQTALKEVAVK